MSIASGVGVISIHEPSSLNKVINCLLQADYSAPNGGLFSKNIVWKLINKYYTADIYLRIFAGFSSLQQFQNHEEFFHTEALILLIDGSKEWKECLQEPRALKFISSSQTNVILDFDPDPGDGSYPKDEDLLTYCIQNHIEWISLWRSVREEETSEDVAPNLSLNSETSDSFLGLTRLKDIIFSHPWPNISLRQNTCDQKLPTIIGNRDIDYDLDAFVDQECNKSENVFLEMMQNMSRLRERCMLMNDEDRKDFAANICMEFLERAFNEDTDDDVE